MATKLTVDVDSIEILEKDQQEDSYSFKQCKEIGKHFLDELKKAVKVECLPNIREPRAKATKYLEETEVLQLLEVRSSFFYSSYSLFNRLYSAQRYGRHLKNKQAFAE